MAGSSAEPTRAQNWGDEALRISATSLSCRKRRSAGGMRGSPLLVGLLAASRACGCFALLAVVSTRLLQVCRGPPVPHLGGPQLHTTYARRTACGRRAPQICRSGAVCATPDRALARPAS